MKNLSFVIAVFISINLCGQGNSPKEVFQLLDKAYTANDFEAMKKLYYQKTEDDKKMIDASITIIQLKPKVVALRDKINKKYPGTLNKEMIGFILGAIATPVYYKEKTESAEITITDNKASSVYKDPEGLNPKDFFIQMDSKWYVDPNDGNGVSNVEITLKQISIFESILDEANKSIAKNIPSKDFYTHMNQLLQKK